MLKDKRRFGTGINQIIISQDSDEVSENHEFS